MTEKATLEDARELTAKWAPKFGFGSYRFRVDALPKGTKGAWGKSVWLHDDDFFEIRVFPNVLDMRQMEALVIHELTHGLILLAEAGREEAVCNRMAKLLMGEDVQTPNIWALRKTGAKQWSKDGFVFGEVWSSVSPLVQAALPLIVDDLPPRELVLVNAVYWEGVSLMEVARRLGVSRRTAGRLHKQAMKRLRSHVEELEEATSG